MNLLHRILRICHKCFSGMHYAQVCKTLTQLPRMPIDKLASAYPDANLSATRVVSGNLYFGVHRNT